MSVLRCAVSVWTRHFPIDEKERGLMLQEAGGEDLIDTWTLVDADWRLVANKHGATRLGFALLLKFFESGARFPREPAELPAAAVAYVAEQVKVRRRSSPSTGGLAASRPTIAPRSGRRSVPGADS